MNIYKIRWVQVLRMAMILTLITTIIYAVIFTIMMLDKIFFIELWMLVIVVLSLALITLVIDFNKGIK